MSDPERKEGSITIRCEPELIAAIDAEAAALSKAAGGARIARSEAARLALRRALAHQLAPPSSKGKAQPASSKRAAAKR
jgi:hypothetical protein